jgi:hypothetical protein
MAAWFLTSTLDESECSVSGPGIFTFGKIVAGNHCLEGRWAREPVWTVWTFRRERFLPLLPRPSCQKSAYSRLIVKNCRWCERKQQWPKLIKYPGICLEGLGKITQKLVMLVGILVEIWNRHTHPHQNTRPTHLRLSLLSRLFSLYPREHNMWGKYILSCRKWAQRFVVFRLFYPTCIVLSPSVSGFVVRRFISPRCFVAWQLIQIQNDHYEVSRR